MATFMHNAQLWVDTVLLWVGFGTVVGLLAKALMPGRDQGGAVATLLMGIGGSVVGLGLLALLWEGHRASPTSPLGFVAATAGAFVLLFFHRLLQGSFFREMGTGPATTKHRRRASVMLQDE